MPKKKYMDDVKYDPESRTLTGKVVWDDSVMLFGLKCWDYKLIFDKDFKEICGGFY